MRISTSWMALLTASLGMVCVAGRAEAQANELLITVIGTVIPGQDTDSSDILGFGVSPAPGFPDGTAAGQPVTMTFVLDLNRIPPNVCAAPGSCFPEGRAYYFTNSTPASSWITATDTLGGKVVPEFAPHGGNFDSPAYADLFTQGDTSSPYNELTVESDQTIRTTTSTGGGSYEEILSDDTTFLRIDSVTTPFLNGLSLNQSFSWNPSEDDGLSSAGFGRDISLATCTSAGICTSSGILSEASVGVQIDSVTVRKLPEPGTFALMALGLGGVGFAHRRRRRAT